jgi:tRNA G18 (ribose-2'-O)-methylase SpoU
VRHRDVDSDDARLADFRRLNEPRFRRRYEQVEGVFVAEGPTVLAHIAERAPESVRSVLAEPRALDRVPPTLDVPVYTCAGIREVVGFDFHRGMLAVCRRPPDVALDELVRLESLVVIEGVNDHENLGAIIRAAAGLGVGGILLDPTTADPWYRRSVRVSVGTVVDLPIGRASSWPEDLGSLWEAGMTLVASSPEGDSQDVRTIARIDRPAIALGAEGAGLSPAVLAMAERRVRIPMRPGVDSLNVAQAAAILFDRLVS